MRPGISDEMLARVGVRRVGSDEALQLCGLPQSGLFLPYRDLEGTAVMDGGKPYGRLRLDRPQDGKKYHQASGTAVHAYLTPGLNSARPGCRLFVPEGEFKALSLHEAGLLAVGISGFFGFALKGGEELTPELSAVLAKAQPERIYFCGDSDTAYNYQFAVGALSFAKLVHPIPLFLPRIPLNGPGKGVDDCRQALGENFCEWWSERLAQAVPVDPASEPAHLAVELLQREAGTLSKLQGSDRWKAEKRLAQMAAALESQPLAQDQVMQFAMKELKIGKVALRKAIKCVLGDQKREAIWSKYGESDGTICLSRATSEWTRQICESVAGETFRYTGNLCRWFEGKLHPQTAAEIVSFIDDPSRCVFSQKGKEGNVPATFTEAHARVFLGSWMNNMDLLRQVDVVSPVPVLAWNGEAATLVNDYCPKTRILATSGKLVLPPAKEAVERFGHLLQDYDLATPGDWGRTIALFLTLGLVQGGFLGKGRAPLFLIRKNKHQAGGSLLLRLVCAIYGLKPRPVSQSEKPERVIEDLSRALLAGDGFIYFDNVRGNGLKHLPALESLLTEPKFTCRAPYLHGEADVTRRVLAVSSNGAPFSPDLASRTVEICLRKRPADYKFYDWPEGGIEEHVTARRTDYLGAVYALIDEWAKAGRPAGKTTGFRFAQWERACSWIIETFFNGMPLLDTEHEQAQARLADPDYDLLRNLFRLVVEGESRGELTASGFAEIATQAGLLPGTVEENRLRLGKALKRRFPDDGEYEFDGGEFVITRESRENPSQSHSISYYTIQPAKEAR